MRQRSVSRPRRSTAWDWAFSGWYDYNSSNHVLSPHDVLYFVRTVEGNVFKWRFLNYYYDGNPGYISFDTELVESSDTDSDTDTDIDTDSHSDTDGDTDI